ncbi:MAG: hypothetical protein AAGB12_16235 [Pseudomonadota bacterium]
MKPLSLSSQALAVRVQELEKCIRQFNHDLVTPVQVVRMCAALANRTLPTLIKVYEQVGKQVLEIPEIKRSDLQDLKEALTTVEKRSQSMLSLLRLMLSQLKTENDQLPDTQVYTISDITTQVIRGMLYTLDKQTRQKIHLNVIQDFMVTAHKASIERVSDLTCETKEGEYTSFILTFPLMHKITHEQ